MNLWNKIFVGLVIVAALGFFYTAARTLKTQQHWREKAQRFEQRVAQADEEKTKLRAEVVQLKLDLRKVTNDRGRVWYDCRPEKAPTPAGEVSVAVNDPSPHGISDKLVLFVFDASKVEDGGRFLGEFQVAGVNQAQVALKPARPMSSRQLQALAASAAKGPWVLFDKMPFDSHELFAGMSEDQKRALLPVETLPEYLKHGQPSTWEQIQDEKFQGELVDDRGVPLVDDKGKPIPDSKGNFWRSLRDYQALLTQFDSDRAILIDLIASMQRDERMAAEAAADAKQEIAFHDRTVVALKGDLAKVSAERSALAGHLKALKDKVAQLKAGVDQLIAGNQAMAAEIARIQSQATRIIDERTRTMARSGEGRSDL